MLRFHTGMHLYAGQPFVLLGRIYDQFLPALNQTAHIVGQSAPRIRNVLPFRHDQNFRTAVLPHALRRRLCPGSYPADYQYLHVVLLSFMFFLICSARSLLFAGLTC